MKGLVQRVRNAAVHVDGRCVGSIEHGLCVFVGVGHDDGDADAELLADRLSTLRIFADEDGKMNLSVADTGGAVLVVSQFTLMGDTRRGRRPSFVAAAAPAAAEPLVERVAERLRKGGIDVATGRFGAHMDIELHADGPVTLMLDTAAKRSGGGAARDA